MTTSNDLDESVVVGITYPAELDPRPPARVEADLRLLRDVHPRVTVVTAPYTEGTTLEEQDLRAWSNMTAVLAHHLPPDLTRVAPALRWVHLIGSGTEHTISSFDEDEPLILTSSSGLSASSIAEFAVGRLLAHWKHFDAMSDSQSRREWTPRHGRLLAGCSVGVIGLGAIGTEVCRRLRAFDVEIWGCRRSDTRTDLVDRLVRPHELETLLQAVDAVILAVPATRDTESLLDDDAFRAMRPGGWICNVSRGSVIDEHALVRHLRSGHLSGAAIDVAREEPLPDRSRLWDCDTLSISAHCAASLDGYYDRVHAMFRDNLARLLRGDALINVVELSNRR